MSKRKPDINIEKALRETEEQRRIDEAAPTRKRLAEELGPFRTAPDVPTYVEEPDGSSQVNITSEKADPVENRRRWALMVEATDQRRALEIERTHRREAETDHVTVYDERTGEARDVPVQMEDRIAKKKWARASRGGRKYFTGGWLGR